MAPCVPHNINNHYPVPGSQQHLFSCAAHPAPNKPSGRIEWMAILGGRSAFTPACHRPATRLGPWAQEEVSQNMVPGPRQVPTMATTTCTRVVNDRTHGYRTFHRTARRFTRCPCWLYRHTRSLPHSAAPRTAAYAALRAHTTPYAPNRARTHAPRASYLRTHTCRAPFTPVFCRDFRATRARLPPAHTTHCRCLPARPAAACTARTHFCRACLRLRPLLPLPVMLLVRRKTYY